MDYDFYIRGHKWNIELVNIDNPLLCSEDNCGVTHFSKSKIVINKEMDINTIIDTAGHELCHAFMFICGFGQFETFTEENICDMLAVWGVDYGLMQLEITAWLRSVLKD